MSRAPAIEDGGGGRVQLATTAGKERGDGVSGVERSTGYGDVEEARGGGVEAFVAGMYAIEPIVEANIDEASNLG
jgi:hypothetical protein